MRNKATPSPFVIAAPLQENHARRGAMLSSLAVTMLVLLAICLLFLTHDPGQMANRIDGDSVMQGP